MPAVSESALGKLVTAAVSGVATAAAKPNNDLSSSAVASSKTVLREEVARAIEDAPTMQNVAVVDVKSAWLSKTTIGAGIGTAATLLTLFGIDLDKETQDALLAVIVGGTFVWTWAMRTFFTKTITPTAAGK